MSQDETRAATMALGNKMFGGIHAEPNATIRRNTGNPFAKATPGRRATPALMDVVAKRNPKLAVKKQPNLANRFGKFLGSSLGGNVDTTKELIGNAYDATSNIVSNDVMPAINNFMEETGTPAINNAIGDAGLIATQIGKDLGLGNDEPINTAVPVVSQAAVVPQGAVQSPVVEQGSSRRLTTPQGYIERSGEGNLNGMSGQEVLNRLVKRRNGALESEVGASNRNPFKPQETVHNPNGIPASGAVDYLHTPQGTGQHDAYGREIKKTPRSVQLESALDFNYNKNDKKAKKYDDAIKSGLSPQEAYADVVNSSRSFKDREVRLQERAQTEKHAIDTRTSDVAEKAQITDQLKSEASANLDNAKANAAPAQAKYWEAYAKQLGGANSTSEKNTLNKAFFDAMVEIGEMPAGPEKDLAIAQINAARNGKRLKITQQATDAIDGGIFGTDKPALPYAFTEEVFDKK